MFATICPGSPALRTSSLGVVMDKSIQLSHKPCVSFMLSPASSSQYFHLRTTRLRDLFANVIASRLHLDGSMPYPSSHDSHLAGLCSGALAAAAISTSSSLHELIPTAVQTVVLALHIGLRAAEMAQSLEASPTGSTWSMVIPGLTSEAISQVLDDFCSKTVSAHSIRSCIVQNSRLIVQIANPKAFPPICHCLFCCWSDCQWPSAHSPIVPQLCRHRVHAPNSHQRALPRTPPIRR